MSSTYESFEFTDNTELEASKSETRSEAAAKTKPSVFVLGVSVLTLFFVTQLMQLFPKLNGLPLVKIIVALVAIIFVTTPHLIANRWRLGDIPQFKYLLGILLLGVLTLPFSYWRGGSVNFLMETFVKNVVFAYLLVQGAKDNRSSRMIAGALVLGCSLIVLAIMTGFGPEVSIYEAEQRMMVGGTYDVNDLALLFVVTLPFAFFLMKEASFKSRLLLFCAIGLMLLGMVKTASRGGFLGLVVISLFIFVRSSSEARKYVLIGLLVCATLFVVAAPASFWNRINTIFALEQDYNMQDGHGRKSVWQNGIKMLITHPLTGVGIGSFNEAHRVLSDGHIYISPHNSFIQVMAELGVGGILCFLAIIITAILGARRARRLARDATEAQELWWLASAIEVSIVGFMVSGALLSHAYSPIFCFLAAISASLTARYKIFANPTTADEESEYAWNSQSVE
ncbi:MAG: O-antigen ligase family protein [Acidobacteriota bacterium]